LKGSLQRRKYIAGGVPNAARERQEFSGTQEHRELPRDFTVCRNYTLAVVLQGLQTAKMQALRLCGWGKL
jgi:hypothetical protein